MLTSTVKESGRQFACDGEQVTFTCQVVRSFSLEWRSSHLNPITYTANDMPPSPRTQDPFEANLTFLSRASVDSNITSTLRMTRFNDAVSVQCLSTQDNETEAFTETGNNYHWLV